MCAYATPFTFTDEAAFRAALGDVPLRMESFEISAGSPTPLFFPTVTVQCAGGCDSSFGTSLLFPTEGEQGIQLGGADTISFTWGESVVAVGLDVSGLGTDGPTDLILIINGNTLFVLKGYEGSPGGRLFIGLIDPIGFSSLLLATQGEGDDPDGRLYIDRLLTLPIGAGTGTGDSRRWNAPGIYGGERAPDFDLTDVDGAADLPEPGTTWLMLAGLGAVGLGRQLRRR